MLNIFTFLENNKGKPIPQLFKLYNKLPFNKDELSTDGNLNLAWYQINWLPDNYTINGWLHLHSTELKQLPNKLIVNGWLDISYTEISVLPDDLIVYGDLYCHRTPLAENIKNNPHLLKKYSKQVKDLIVCD